MPTPDPTSPISNFTPAEPRVNADEGVVLSWEVPEGQEEKIAGLQLFCGNDPALNLPPDSRSYTTDALTAPTAFLLIATDKDANTHLLTTTVLVDGAKLTLHDLTIEEALTITS
ncbi:hypothetical protein [Streptomyces sp. NPDC055709]